MNDSSKRSHEYFSMGGQQPGGFVARIIALIIGCLVFIAAVFVGAVFLAGLIGMLVIGGIVVTLRVWWLRRKMGEMAKSSGDIEGQYTVIREEDIRTYIDEDDRRS